MEMDTNITYLGNTKYKRVLPHNRTMVQIKADLKKAGVKEPLSRRSKADLLKLEKKYMSRKRKMSETVEKGKEEETEEKAEVAPLPKIKKEPVYPKIVPTNVPRVDPKHMAMHIVRDEVRQISITSFLVGVVGGVAAVYLFNKVYKFATAIDVSTDAIEE